MVGDVLKLLLEYISRIEYGNDRAAQHFAVGGFTRQIVGDKGGTIAGAVSQIVHVVETRTEVEKPPVYSLSAIAVYKDQHRRIFAPRRDGAIEDVGFGAILGNGNRNGRRRSQGNLGRPQKVGSRQEW